MASLRRDARQGRRDGRSVSLEPHSPVSDSISRTHIVDAPAAHDVTEPSNLTSRSSSRSESPSNVALPLGSRYNHSRAASIHGEHEHRFTNPLVSGLSQYVAVPKGQSCKIDQFEIR